MEHVQFCVEMCVNRGGWGLSGLDDVLRNLVIDDEVDDFLKRSKDGSSSCSLLSLLQEQAIPKVEVQPWCS